MSMNIGSTPEEQKRIDTLIDFMGDYLTSDIVWRLKQMGFFIVPASIHHHGKYEGALPISPVSTSTVMRTPATPVPLVAFARSFSYPKLSPPCGASERRTEVRSCGQD